MAPLNAQRDGSSPVALVFACSGASESGYVTDSAARRLAAEGKARMFCLAGIGGHIPSFIRTTSDAACIVVLDGCPMDCAGRTLREAGVSRFYQCRVTDLQLEDDAEADADTLIGALMKKGEQLLARG